MTTAVPPVKRSRSATPSRGERARATQQRIVKAAYQLFITRGYAATTMAEIADDAGVAVQTVYFSFHTKAALLSRTYDFAVMGEGQPLIPQEQAWYQAMIAETEVTAALRHLVAGVGEITRRVTPLYLVARGGAADDAETARVTAFHEDWRARGYRDLLDLLHAKAPLRRGLTPERATHLLLLYTGMDVFHVLVDVYRWTLEEWIDWTVATLAEQVFGLAGLPAAGGGTEPPESDRPGAPT